MSVSGVSGLLRAPSGGLLDVDLDAPADLRIIRRIGAPGGGMVFDQAVVGTFPDSGTLERRLRLPPVAPSWTGQRVEIRYLLEVAVAGRDTTELPLEVEPGEAPAQDASEPTTEQRSWQQLGVARRKTGGCIGTVVEIVLTLASFAAVGQLAEGCLSGHLPPAVRIFPALAGMGWLLAMAVVVPRRLRDRRAHLGWVEPPTAALGGFLRGRALRPARAALVLVEHYSVAVGNSGETRPMELARTITRQELPAGPFQLHLPVDQPASIGALHGGVRWWLDLEAADGGATRLPFTVLPWRA